MSLLLAPHYPGNLETGVFQPDWAISESGKKGASGAMLHDGRLQIVSQGNSISLTQIVGNWLTGGGNGALYEARATYVGTAPSGPVNSWVNLGTDRVWKLSGSGHVCTISVEIRLASDKSHVGNGTIDLSTNL